MTQFHELQAQDLAKIINHYRPDWPTPPIKAMLTSDKLIGYAPAQILATIFDLAADPTAKTIQALPARLERLYGTWGSRTPNLTEPQATLEPHGRSLNQPVTRRESCEIHEGGLKGNCAGCRADALAVFPEADAA